MKTLCTFCLLLILLCGASALAQTRGQRSSSMQDMRVIADIRQVDFKNFTYRSRGEDGREYSFRLRNGKYNNRVSRTENYATQLDRVVYGDLTGDGKDEAVVLLIEEVSPSVADQPIYVYSIKNGQVTKRADLAGGSNNCVLEGEECTVLDIKVENGLLIVVRAIPSDQDAKCCPSLHRSTKYRLSGSRLVEVGKTRIMRRS